MEADQGGGGLVVSGGGVVTVATDLLVGHALSLDGVAEALEAAGRRLDELDRLVSASLLTAADAPLSARRAEVAIDLARADLAHASTGATHLAQLLRVGANAYGATEHAVAGLIRGAAAGGANAAGWVVGSFGLIALGAAAPFLLGGAGGLALAAMLRPREFRGALGAVGARLSDHRAVISSPLTVSAVRLAAMSVDDFGAGLVRLPPTITALLGDEGLGIIGIDTSATVLVGAASAAGLLRETQVGVTAVATAPSTPASGFGDRAARIPVRPLPDPPITATRGLVTTIGTPPTGPPAPSPQIRIDRYEQAGQPDRFEVYLGGTLDFAAIATDEPFDLTSDVGGIAGLDATGSYRSVELALAASGATSESPLVVSGYSQGGLVAAMLAASDEHTVTGLYTLGAPVAQVPVPGSVPWVAMEHTDDLVPASGGMWTSLAPVVVEREVFSEGPPDTPRFFPAHDFAQYTASAAMLDGAADPRITGVRAALDQDSSAVTVQSTWYEARREPRL